MKNPSRDLSRVIHSAQPLVICNSCVLLSLTIVSYLMANVGYFAVLPMSVIASSETIALVTPESDCLTFRTLVRRCSAQQEELSLQSA